MYNIVFRTYMNLKHKQTSDSCMCCCGQTPLVVEEVMSATTNKLVFHYRTRYHTISSGHILKQTHIDNKTKKKLSKKYSTIIKKSNNLFCHLSVIRNFHILRGIQSNEVFTLDRFHLSCVQYLLTTSRCPT